MHQPDALKRNEPLTWSPGNGAEVWQPSVAGVGGDLATVRLILRHQPELGRRTSIIELCGFFRPGPPERHPANAAI